MPTPVFISSYQCARLLQTTKEEVRKLLDSEEIDYFRDNEQVFRIRLDSILEYASRSQTAIDKKYYDDLTRRFTTTLQNSGIATQTAQLEQSPISDEDVPSGKYFWKTGVAIAERFRNRKFLSALYKDERLADMMFRYFSGETLELIGGAYDLTRERARQLCKKGLNILMHHLSYFTKDVVEMKGGEENEAKGNNRAIQGSGFAEINGMRFTKRARTVFRKHGINTVEQLQSLSKSDLMKLPGLGRKTLLEIVRVLEYAKTPEGAQKAFQFRPWTEEDIEKVVSLKRSGKSYQEIAEQLDRFTIDVQDQYYLRMRELRNERTMGGFAGIDSSETKHGESGKPLLWSEEDVTRLTALRSQGMSVRDIAKQLQLNQREVSSKLAQLGFKIGYHSLADLSADEKDELASRFHKGESLAGLAVEHQLKQVDLAQLLIEKGELPERNAQTGQPWNLEEINALRSYVERGYPMAEIGYRLGRDYREITLKIYELVKSIRQ